MVLFLLIFVVFPVLTAPAYKRYLRADGLSASITVAYSFYLTPALNAGVATLLLALAPGHGHAFYLAAILGFNLGLLALSVHGLPAFLARLAEETRHRAAWKLSALAFLLIFFFHAALVRPLGNDVTEYLEIGKVFYNAKSLFYPVLPFAPANAFDSHSTHPPLLMALFFIGYLLQGTAEHIQTHHLILAFFNTALIGMLLTIMRKNLPLAAGLSILCLFQAKYPTLSLLMPRGIDALRIGYFLFAYSCLEEYLTGSRVGRLLLGLSLGFALGTHSSGLIVLLLFVPTFWLLSRETSARDRLAALAAVFGIAVAAGGWQYLANLLHHGKLISDDTRLWLAFDYDRFLRYERDLYSPQLMWGAFLDQFRIPNPTFGYTVPVFVACLVLRAKSGIANLGALLRNAWTRTRAPIPTHYAYLIFALGYWSALALSIAADKTLLIKNYRYVLTAFPFMLVASHRMLLEAFEGAQPARWATAVRAWSAKAPVNRARTCAIALLAVAAQAFFLARWFHGVGSGKTTLSLREYAALPGNHLEKLPPGEREIIRYLNERSEGGDILAFKREQLYQYVARRKIYFYLNDALEPLYRARSEAALWESLRAMGIRYVFWATSTPFIVHQSQLHRLLANPRYARIALSEYDFSLFELHDEPRALPGAPPGSAVTKPVDLKPGESQDADFDVAYGQDYLVSLRTDRPGAFYRLSIKKRYACGPRKAKALFSARDIVTDIDTTHWIKTGSRILGEQECAVVLSVPVAAKDSPVKGLLIVEPAPGM